MRYDPFSAPNLMRICAVTGLVVMMTEALPSTTCLAVGVFCLLGAGVFSLFPAPRETAAEKRRRAKPRPAMPVQAAVAPYMRPPWTPPPRPAKPGGRTETMPSVDPHPAIFASVSGRNTRAGSSRRRDD